MIHTYTKKAANKLYRYYVCVKAHQSGWNKCETRSVAALEIEEAMVDQIRGIGTNSALLDEVVRQLEEQRETHAGALERERRFIERDLKRLAEEMPGVTTGSGAATRLAEAMERTESLGHRLSEIRGHLAALDGDPISRAEVEQALRGFDGLWRQMTPREQERFVKLIVEQVRYNGKTGVVTVDFRSTGIRQLCVDGNRPR
jgi:site-specific DNA recombinase